MSDVYPPRVPESCKGPDDVAILTVAIMLSMLADRLTDNQILALLEPRKIRVALEQIRMDASAATLAAERRIIPAAGIIGDDDEAFLIPSPKK